MGEKAGVVLRRVDEVKRMTCAEAVQIREQSEVGLVKPKAQRY